MSCALLAAYMVAAVGVLPSPGQIAAWVTAAGRQLEPSPERYPCEDCPCGCSSARSCWTACCCHSDAQKLAWAMREGVTVPSYVRFSEQTWAQAQRTVEASAGCSGCCGSGGGSDEAAELAGSKPVRRAISPLSCRGVTSLALASLPPTFVPSPSAVLPTEQRAVFLGWPGALAASTRALDIHPPPPRSAITPG